MRSRPLIRPLNVIGHSWVLLFFNSVYLSFHVEENLVEDLAEKECFPSAVLEFKASHGKAEPTKYPSHHPTHSTEEDAMLEPQCIRGHSSHSVTSLQS